MEVLSFFISKKSVLLAFDQFIYGYEKLKLSAKDGDTAYFTKDGRNELYYHYLLDDIDTEFSYNYPEEDTQAIKAFFKGRDFYLFDLSYREELFIEELLKDFKNFLKKKGEKFENEILISHPHQGLIGW